MAKILGRRTHRTIPVNGRRGTYRPLAIGGAFGLIQVGFSAGVDHQAEGPAKRQRIGAHFPLMPWIVTSPVFLVFCADVRRLERICTVRNHPQRNGDLEAFLNASVGAALAMQTFILAAESAGHGCCPISLISNQVGAVANELALPDGVFPVAGLCVGYPAGRGP
jgi:nitroreductase